MKIGSVAAALLLYSLAARADDRRLDAIRVEGLPPAADSPVTPETPREAQGTPRDPRVVPRDPQQQASPASAWLSPVHVGGMIGLALPRPFDAELFVRIFGFVSLGFSYS